MLGARSSEDGNDMKNNGKKNLGCWSNLHSLILIKMSRSSITIPSAYVISPVASIYFGTAVVATFALVIAFVLSSDPKGKFGWLVEILVNIISKVNGRFSGMATEIAPPDDPQQKSPALPVTNNTATMTRSIKQALRPVKSVVLDPVVKTWSSSVYDHPLLDSEPHSQLPKRKPTASGDRPLLNKDDCAQMLTAYLETKAPEVTECDQKWITNLSKFLEEFQTSNNLHLSPDDVEVVAAMLWYEPIDEDLMGKFKTVLGPELWAILHRTVEDICTPPPLTTSF